MVVPLILLITKKLAKFKNYRHSLGKDVPPGHNRPPGHTRPGRPKIFKHTCLGPQAIALSHINFFTKLAAGIFQNRIICLPLLTSGTAATNQSEHGT